MKKLLALVFLLLSGVLYFFLVAKNNSALAPTASLSQKPTPQPLPTSQITNQVLFVPYWNQDSIVGGYNTYAYFGITTDKNGIDTTEPGYANLPAFALKTENTKTLLVVRLLSGKTTEDLLQDKSNQEKVIADSIRIAKTYQFNGIILDLEYSALALPSVTKSTTDFSVQFAQETKNAHLEYDQLLYGDTFYLARPFDARQIAKYTDTLFVMSYDFHKANGTPGPNFPFNTLSDADYNFQLMIQDFTKAVSKNKLAIVFGMFGYDWTIDDKQRSIKSAESLTVNEIQNKFFPHCLFKDCKIILNKAKETNILYTDGNNQRHSVWFENTASVAIKKTFLQKEGISQIGFWANEYF